jgi:murein L,D-transpeptidase YcbB/YkuD
MRSARSSILAGTALALILATDAGAAPATSNPTPLAPHSRDYSTPGSMPKPSSPFAQPDNDMRFRGPLPGSGDIEAHRDTATPLAPASNEIKTAPSRPPVAPRPTAIERPIERPAPQLAPVQISQPAALPVAQPAPVQASQPPARPVAEDAQASVPPPAAEPRRATAPAPEPRRVERPAPPAGANASETELAGKIREIIIKKQIDRVIERKADRDAIVTFYQKDRDFRPLWVAGGLPSARAKDVADYLDTIEADGLDPKDYPLPKFSGDARSQAEAELKFTAMVLTYARHASTGRVHFTRVSPNIEYKLTFDAIDALQKIGGSNDLPQTLDGFEPQQPAYKALKARYDEMRNQPTESAPARMENGPVLRYFRDRNGHETVMADTRVPQLRERLGLAAEPNSNYNAALSMAVGKFQKANGIQVTGQLNAPTIEALNGPSRSKQLDAIVATLERWRWMPRELGQTHVVLNIPDFNIRVYHDGAKVWQTRTVVGKPDHQTPMLSETMKFITVNPTWNVPESIIYNELLPLYETSDPQIFERQGLKVERQSDGHIRVYQPPGERNALGQIRFNFPNKFLVYQHDTPEKNYFAHDKRAYSHGCQRVQDPLKYAEVLLSYAAPRSGYTAEGIKRMLGGEEKQLDFVNQIPVHITYQTAFVDEAGKLQFRDDVYGHDAKLISILRGPERQVADQAIERPADPNFKPSAEQGARLRSAAGGGGPGNPFEAFSRLFR